MYFISPHLHLSTQLLNGYLSGVLIAITAASAKATIQTSLEAHRDGISISIG